jgi:molybdate transport system ATP-binding protein
MTLSATIAMSWPTLDLDVDVHVETGQTLAIMGPNGAGKSTIVRCLAGLTPIRHGRIHVDDVVWDDPASGQFVSPAHRNVGLMFQDHLLFRHLTALDNVAFGPRARGQSQRDARLEAAACLERLGLSDLTKARPSQLSGGQSQRVALARALVNRPTLLLLDEPLASLDVVTRRHMRSEISRDLAAFQPSTILITHDPEDARHLADQVMVIEAGRVVQRGTPDELSAQPATPYVAELFGSQ